MGVLGDISRRQRRLVKLECSMRLELFSELAECRFVYRRSGLILGSASQSASRGMCLRMCTVKTQFGSRGRLSVYSYFCFASTYRLDFCVYCCPGRDPKTDCSGCPWHFPGLGITVRAMTRVKVQAGREIYVHQSFAPMHRRWHPSD